MTVDGWGRSGHVGEAGVVNTAKFVAPYDMETGASVASVGLVPNGVVPGSASPPPRGRAVAPTASVVGVVAAVVGAAVVVVVVATAVVVGTVVVCVVAVVVLGGVLQASTI